MPMPDSAAAPFKAASAPLPVAGDGLGRRWQRAACLALVTSIYMLGGYLWRNRVPPGEAVLQFLHTFAGQFIVAWCLLWTIGRGLGSDAGHASWMRMAATIAASTVLAALLHGIAASAPLSGQEFHLPKFTFVLLWTLCLSTLLVVALRNIERGRVAAVAWHASQVRRLALEREVSSAQSQLLQAQVEPHFIFNALANVRRLLRTDTAAARTLLTDLLRYLEEALPRLREDHTTLAREAELVRAYLAVHQVRMGPRLHATIDVPPELAERALPPMVLLTLVENALKHGLRPMVDGGTIRVTARSFPGRLVLSVADTGRGMGDGIGHGTGLANLRSRLKAMYGAEASLALAINEPRGVVATITLPDGPR
jgi:signal transduction histidine kinase